VNESGGYVERKKSKQPKNNQDRGDYPKHVFISLLLSAGNIRDFVLPNCSDASSCLGEDCKDCTATRLVTPQKEVCAVVNTFCW